MTPLDRATPIPTGCASLDRALGIGGLRRGTIVEIFGEESTGKTTLALHIIAQSQKLGGRAAFLDAEHSLDLAFAKRIGVDLDRFLFSQPDHGEQGLEIVEHLLRSASVDVVVIDTVASLVPRAELEGTMGEDHSLLQGRLLSESLRRLSAIIQKSHSLLIFCNQVRSHIEGPLGNSTVTPGGRSLGLHASVRIELHHLGMVGEGSTITGHKIRAHIVKNRLATPFESASFEIDFERGIC